MCQSLKVSKFQKFYSIFISGPKSRAQIFLLVFDGEDGGELASRSTNIEWLNH